MRKYIGQQYHKPLSYFDVGAFLGDHQQPTLATTARELGKDYLHRRTPTFSVKPRVQQIQDMSQIDQTRPSQFADSHVCDDVMHAAVRCATKIVPQTSGSVMGLEQMVIVVCSRPRHAAASANA